MHGIESARRLLRILSSRPVMPIKQYPKLTFINTNGMDNRCVIVQGERK